MLSEYTTASPDETIALARDLARQWGPGRVIALEASLGGGKTVFAKGYAAGCGIADMDTVTSPTFTLVNRYDADGVTVYHLDLYRLHGSADAEAIGIDEIFASGRTVLIEWAERIVELLPRDCIRITLETLGENSRRVIVDVPKQERV